MTDTQKRIVKLCKEKGMPVSSLERQIGAANGYVKDNRQREFPTDRLSQMADILGVSVNYLITGKDDYLAKLDRDFLAAQLEQIDRRLGILNRKIVTPDDFKDAFYGNDPDLTAQDRDELWEDAIAYIEYRKQQRKGKKVMSP